MQRFESYRNVNAARGYGARWLGIEMMCQEKQRNGRVKQCVAEAKLRKVTLCIAKGWQSSAQRSNGDAQSSKASSGNGIEMNRSAMDLLGTAQQRLCEG